MKKLYFSFIGNCKGYKVDYPQISNFCPIYSVPLCNGYIAIYETVWSDWVVVSELNQVQDWDRETGELYYYDDISYFMVKRNSFDCNPVVPVSSFGEQLAIAIGR